MKYIRKELKDYFKNKTVFIYFVLLFILISYSFYASVDLYSKASVSAIGNPLYATGFEPVPGVFVPAIGGFFIILSLIAPFLFVQPIVNEKKNNTITILAQLPVSMNFLFFKKYLAAMIILVFSFISVFPIVLGWYFLGGHVPVSELLLLLIGYFLYGMFVISVSFFSASIFRENAHASIFSLSLLVFPWFVDFGREMNILSFFNVFSKWTVTNQLKFFENGILSLQSIFYFILLILLFAFSGFLFFDFNIKNKIKPLFITIFVFALLFVLNNGIHFDFDLSESRRNSFSIAETRFLKKLPPLTITIFLEPTDSRTKDYLNDFLKKLKMVKNDVTVRFVSGKSLESEYGKFRYSFDGKSAETYSNSEEEIFMLLQELSGKKIEKSSTETHYKGFPLVVKKNWSVFLFAFYLIGLPFVLFIIYYKTNIFYNRRKL